MECPKLRNLEFFPVREGETQSVGLRDPEGISDGILFLPPNVFYLVQFLDGQHTRNQIAGEYLKRFGEILMPQWVDKFIADLDEKLFLEGERFEAAKQALLESFRAQPTRPATFAGKSYEADPEKLKQQLDGFFRPKEGPGSSPSEHAGKALKAIVAPNVEINQAGPIYAWAYKEVREAKTPGVFVILGVARGVIETLFACTDKDFETPLGLVRTDREFLRLFREHGGGVFFQEELAHRKDHAIEFQAVFLQHILGHTKPFTIVPALYTMLKLVGNTKGSVLRYDRTTVDQYNSTVTYAAMAFY